MYHTVNEYRNYLKKKLREDRQNILESWGNGNFTRESVEGTMQLNAKYLGVVEAIDSVIDYLEEDLEEVGFEYD